MKIDDDNPKNIIGGADVGAKHPQQRFAKKNYNLGWDASPLQQQQMNKLK